MTSLVSWVGIDQRGPSSVYFASDSRITWGGGDTWSHGRKLFAARKYPHIFGYCGDVLFPTQSLGQIVELIDAGLIFEAKDGIDVCTERIISILDSAFRTYPSAGKKRFDLLYCMREGQGVSAPFHVRRIAFIPGDQPRLDVVEFPQRSDIVSIWVAAGEAWLKRLRDGEQAMSVERVALSSLLSATRLDLGLIIIAAVRRN